MTHQAPERFAVEAARSHTLPGHFYHDPAIFAEEMATLFARSWLCAGHVSQLAAPGDFITQEVGEDGVVILRDRKGVLRGFYNVCQHRAHRLLEGEGRVSAVITCPYHTWAYGLDGALRTAPGTESLPDFDPAAFGLKPVRVEELCGFVFFNLDPAAPAMAAGLAPFAREFLSFGAAPGGLTRAYRKVLEVKANWKNVIENYAECYHCPNAHPSLATAALDMASYRIAVHPCYQVHTSGNCGAAQGYRLETGQGPRDGDFASWLVWPNTVFEYYPGGKLTLFHNIPLEPERTRQVVEWYLPEAEPNPGEQAIIDFVDVVRAEDIPIVESVQHGLHSRGYGQGRFVVDAAGSGRSEHAVHDFQLKVLTALGRAPTA